MISTCLLAASVAVASPGATASKKASSKPATASAKPASAKKVAKKRATGKRAARKSNWKARGQQGIKADRAREIQAALIRANYMQGPANGVWDDRTIEAMRRYQADKGWQTKIVPDSRALIDLGLGPSYETALNSDRLIHKGAEPGEPTAAELSGSN